MLQAVMEKMPDGGFLFAFGGAILLLIGAIGCFAAQFLRGSREDDKESENG